MKVTFIRGKRGFLSRHPLEARRVYADRLSEVFDVAVPGEANPVRISLGLDEVLSEVVFWRETERTADDYGVLFGEVWDA